MTRQHFTTRATHLLATCPTEVADGMPDALRAWLVDAIAAALHQVAWEAQEVDAQLVYPPDLSGDAVPHPRENTP